MQYASGDENFSSKNMKRPPQRRREMVENNIKMELKEIRCEVGCIHLAQDGDY
jgi:hypothetical protein